MFGWLMTYMTVETFNCQSDDKSAHSERGKKSVFFPPCVDKMADGRMQTGQT